MGWFGYGIYDGDDTQSRHYKFLVLSGCAKNDDEIYDGEWVGLKTTIPKDKIPIFIKGIPKILKKMPKCKFWNEDRALEWQMLLSLFLDNNITPTKEIKEKRHFGNRILNRRASFFFCFSPF